jgi:tape measure domain-containing protein
MEQAQIGFTTMLGSAQKAQAFIADMKDFAKKTPFQFTDVQTAASKLLAFGFASEKVRPTLTAIGDAAAALGTGSEGVTRITTALGQIQAKGRVQSDELLQLYEAGIPALDLLSKKLGKSKKDTQDAVTKGLVPAGVAIEAFTTGMEERFGGLMEKQSHTLGGMFSNLKDTVTLGSDRAFSPLVTILKYYLPGATALTGRAMDLLGQKLETTAKWWERNRWEVGFLRSAYQSGGFDYVVQVLDTQTRANGRLKKAWAETKSVLKDASDVWKNSLWPATKNVADALGGKEGLLTPLGAARAILGWMADHPDAGKIIFEGMAIAITAHNLAGLIRGVAGAWVALDVAMSANPLMLIVEAAALLVLGLGFLYTKLNDGRPIWEAAIAGMFPMLGVLMTVKNHLKDIAQWLGIIDSKPKPMGPWPVGQSPNEKIEKGLPKIFPGQAAGGITTRSGASWVAENGPELITLPRSARVDPLPQDHQLPGFGTQVVVNVSGADVLHAQRVADVVVERIQDKLART